MVRLVAPTDVINDNPLDNTNDGSTCSFKVYDTAKDETLSVAAVGTQVALSVTNVSVFTIGDLVEVELDTGTVHDGGAVTGLNVSTGVVSITNGLASNAAAGNRVRVRLGNAIAMTEYGTAKLRRIDWGFEGVLPDTHPGVLPGMLIDIEISFVGSAGGGLNRLDTIHTKVQDSDCH
jgi:hypothetical protein